jgi:transposase
VGSLPPSDHPEILAVKKSAYSTVDAALFPGLSAFETRKVVLGRQRRLVVTHSQNLHDKQRRGFAQTIGKARRQLSELADCLSRGKTRRPRERVEAEIAQIVKARWLDRVISTTLSGEEPAQLRLQWAVNDKALAELEDELFGKRILFTDRDDWTITQVVAGYRSQSHVEADFRQLKDPKVVSFSPMHHFTDSKIRVHVAYCVLALLVALLVARLMVREADHAGLHMSVRELLDTLAGIQETVLLYQGERGRPRARRMLTEMGPPAPGERP